MSGARLVGHALMEGKRRKIKYAVVTMCIGEDKAQLVYLKCYKIVVDMRFLCLKFQIKLED